MLSPAEAKAGGPETGKLSRPTPSLGSGSRPAAIAADRRASTSRLRAWTDARLPPWKGHLRRSAAARRQGRALRRTATQRTHNAWKTPGGEIGAARDRIAGI